MSTTSRLSLLALEPRLVFDGAMVYTFDDALQADAQRQAELAASRQAESADSDLPVALSEADLPGASAPREVVFVDGGIDKLDGLLSALRPEVERVVIRPGEDGLAQVLAHLADRQPYDALHIFGHGRAGEQLLGRTVLNTEGVTGALAQQLQALGQYLTTDADLLLYGCDVAQGDSGATLVRELARLTGADVAASSNTTGSKGDWALEKTEGDIEATADVAEAGAAWGGELAALTVTAEGLYNEGSKWAVFTVNGATSGQLVALDVLDGTTSALDKTRVVFSQDGGATWKDYTINVKDVNASVSVDIWFGQPVASNGGAMLVAVDMSGINDAAYQGTRNFSLSASVVPGAPNYNTGNSGFIITADDPFVQSTQLADVTSFNFQSLALPAGEEIKSATNISIPGLGVFSKVSWQRNVWSEADPLNPGADRQIYNFDGGADSPGKYPPDPAVQPTVGLFAAATADKQVALTLEKASNYLGLWWSAIGSGDRLDFYKAGAKVASVTGAELSQLANYIDGSTFQSQANPSVPVTTEPDRPYRGNPNFPAEDPSVAYSNQANRLGGDSAYAFINLFAKNGLSFDQVIATGESLTGVFESDNWAVGSLTTAQASATSSVIDNGSGRLVQLDANGKPLVVSGAFQFAAPAPDNDLSVAPSGFWNVQPLDLLANDNGAGINLNPASVQLYSAATGGTGAKMLSTAQGVYSVNAQGVLSFQPAADFTGSDTLWYTVADANGKVSARTQVTVSATATTEVLDNAATALKTGADGMVAFAHYGVSDVTVAENAGYAEFTVKAFEGSRINTLRVIDGAQGVAGLDTGLALEIFDGTNWVAYKDWDHIVPGDGDAQRFQSTTFKVRVRVNDDGLVEGSESLKLQVEYLPGQTATGTLTITDNDVAGSLTVEGVKVSENSPYNVFTITAKEGDRFKLELQSESATVGLDVAPSLQWFDGLTWKNYVDADGVTVPTNSNAIAGESVKVLVRHFITEDDAFEGPESYNLLVKDLTGQPLGVGSSVIVDDGSVSTTFAMGTPSATTRYVVPPIDVLANDFHDNGSIDRKTILLYLNDGTAVDPTKGLKSITVAEGTYTVDDATGMVNFKPSRAFTGTAAKIRYTVADTAGVRGAASTIEIGVNSAVVTNTISNNNALETTMATGAVVSMPGQTSPVTVKLALNANNPTDNNSTYAYTNPMTLTVSTIDDKALTSTRGDGLRTAGGSFSSMGYVSWGNTSDYTSALVSAPAGTGFFLTGTNTTARNAVLGLQVVVNELFSSSTSNRLPLKDASGASIRYSMGQYVLTFDRAVNNPLLHFRDLGAGINVGTGNIGFATDLKVSASSVAASDISFTRVSGDNNLAVSTDGQTIYNKIAIPNGDGPGGASGTVRVQGTGITKLVFDVNIWGASSSQTHWYSATQATALAGDLFGMGVTVFDRTPESNPDGVELAGTVVGVNEDGTPEMMPTATAVAADDRPVAVNSLVVNEASPYAVFTVSAYEGQKLNLSLTSGTATAGTDTATALEVWNGSAWVAYSPTAAYTVPTDTDGVASEPVDLLVRVAVKQDSTTEISEQLTLNVSTSTGKTATGTLTIRDDAQGTIFATTATTPGVAPNGTPIVDTFTPKDDDRPVAINSLVVNEGSPYAVFTVSTYEGQKLSLALASGTATVGVDTASTLEVWNGSAWAPFDPATGYTVPSDTDASVGEPVDLLVRLAVKQDSPLEVSEQLTLTVSTSAGKTATGTLTIRDDAQGTIFATQADDPATPANEAEPGVNPDGTPVIDTLSPKDDDAVSVNSLVVNEGSDYVVFTATGTPGSTIKINLLETTGAGYANIDETQTLEVWDGTAWLPVAQGADFTVPAGGTMLVRVNITTEQEPALDGPETFQLRVTAASGGAVTGTATILDDGRGTVFTTLADDPSTPADEAVPGVNPDGTPATEPMATAPVVNPALPDAPLLADDDRPLTVNSLTVNEGSPYAVFTVGAREGQYVQLALGETTTGKDADLGTDTGTALEYFNGSAWVAYTSGSFVKVPSDGDATVSEPASLLVRVAIKPDPQLDGGETFTLTATNTGGSSATGIGTILDDGTGLIYASRPDDPATLANEALTGVNPDGTPALDSTTPKDDDTPITVNDVTVNEGSPYLVFTVTGNGGQSVKLLPDSGTAVLGTDTGTALEVWNGSAWVAYTPDSYVQIPSDGNNAAGDLDTMLVRIAVRQDPNYEVSESFTLTAVAANGSSDTGTGTIVDDGTGTIFAARPDDPATPDNEALPGVNPDGTPVVLDPATVVEDDDRPLSVTGSRVYEAASPYLGFTVTGVEGQTVGLALRSGTGTLGVDTAEGTGGEPLQYWNGSAWVNYDPLNPPTIPQVGSTLNGETGVLHVRIAVKPDAQTETAESVELVATNRSGTPFVGTGYILDDPTASVIPDQPPLSVMGQTVYEREQYLVFTVTGVAGQNLALSLDTTGTGGGHADLSADLGPFAMGSSPVTFTNGGFESNSVGDGSIAGGVVPTGWSYSGDAGISGIYDPNTAQFGYPTGNNIAFFYATGNKAGYFSQLTGVTPQAGESVTVSLDVGRRGGTVIGQVMADGAYVGLYDASGTEVARLPLTQADLTQAAGSFKPFSLTYTAPAGYTGGALSVRIGIDGNNSSGAYLDVDNVSVTTTAPAAPQMLEVSSDGGATWTAYNSSVTLPGTSGASSLLVRTKLVDDAFNEVSETFELVATDTANRLSASGTGTILDNEARGAAPFVDSFTVNEASPFGVFTVTGVAGASVSLDLLDTSDAGSGSTAEPEDHKGGLEYFDTVSDTWKAYDATSAATLPVIQPDGRLLVRFALVQDAPLEAIGGVGETLQLQATYAAQNGTNVKVGGSATGTATIMDDGTGPIFLTRLDDPLTPENEDNLGVTDGNAPQFDDLAPKDDDRGVSVADVTVNEGSPYIVFKLETFVGQSIQLELQSGTAFLGALNDPDVPADASPDMAYFNGVSWVPYTPDSFFDVPAVPGTAIGDPVSVLVRLAVQQDQPYEMSESFTLTATTAKGNSDSATGTILDNGSGDLFSAANTSGTAESPNTNGLPATPDDDRPVNPAFINDLLINEGSPWAVFTITGVPTAQITLALPATAAEGSATLGTDYQDGLQPGELQIFVNGQWVDYNPGTPYPSATGWSGNTTAGSNAVLDASGQLLVRVKLENQQPLEGTEAFQLSLQYTGNLAQSDYDAGSALPQTNRVFTGTALIVDDGSGLVFAAGQDDPTTPTVENTGVDANGKPLLVTTATAPVVHPADPTAALLADDDRPLEVNNATVNEGSPYIVLSVSGAAGQYVKLEASSGTAELGTDAGSTLEYFDGTGWKTYVPGSFVRIPVLGGQSEGSDQNLMVRLTVAQDQALEVSESFTLTATNTGGSSRMGTGTILDEGNGPVFVTTATGPAGVVLNGAGVLTPVIDPAVTPDDDRPLQVTGTTVNEASPYVIWTVAGEQGQAVKLALIDGTGSVAADVTGPLEIFNGTAWVPYTPGSFVPVPTVTQAGQPGVLMVRTSPVVDAPYEMSETVLLQATNASNASAVGASTILDDGTGAVLDETVAPVVVTGQTVTEGMGQPLGFTVTGRPGELLTLALQDATGSVLADTIGPLQVFIEGKWVDYTGQPVAIPVTGALQVRVDVVDDTVREARETLTLVAVPGSGIAATGEGVILDNEPEGSAPQVNSIEVNEASPYAVFTVEGVAGAGVTLTLASGTATGVTTLGATDGGQDFATAMEVFNGSAWVPYDPSATVIGDNGKLPVRMAVQNDVPYEVSEQFTLTVSYDTTHGVTAGVTDGASSTGTATILDDGTGLVFLTGTDAKSTLAGVQPHLGVDASGNPQLDHLVPLNDDRTLSVNSLVVNEGSPYAVFTVMANEGEALTLKLASGTADLGVDTGTFLEYFNGSAWVPYVNGASVEVPADGDASAGEPVPLLVRVAIRQDAPLETAGGVGETFTLTASYVGGTQAAATGTCEILDNGDGTVFVAGLDDPLTTAVEKPLGVGSDGLPLVSSTAPKDNDMALSVTGQTVNEASPYLVFTVSGLEGQPLTLQLLSGSASVGEDTGRITADPATTQVEIFNGTAWVPYTTDQLVMLPSNGDATANEPAQLLVRVTVVNDAPFEAAETLVLQAMQPNGMVASGEGSIVDDGTGVVNAKDDPATPADESAPLAGVPTLAVESTLNDDRGANPAVSDVQVNEGSPFAVFQVSGVPGAGVTLSLASGTASVGEDTGTLLEVFNGTAWAAYNPATAVVPASGALLVRVAINPDTPFERSEDFTLTATYNNAGVTTGITVGGSATGTGTILDDGSGDIFLPTNQSASPSQPIDSDYPAVLDDDRGVSVLGDTVWESDGHLVFTVSGVEGQNLTLSLSSGTAAVGTDTGTQLQYWNGTQWVDYRSGSGFTMRGDGDGMSGEPTSVHLRVAVLENADTGTPGDERFTLTATPSSGKAATGVGVIKEGERPQALLDDDRPVTVNDVTVNEGSPYAVFTVSGAPGQYVKLALGSTNSGTDASLGTDTASGGELEYWNGSAWVGYIPSSFVQIPAGSSHLLVRVEIASDTLDDNGETFLLRASNTSGGSDVGLGTILDDGTGTVFLTELDDPSTPAVDESTLSGVSPDGLPLTAPTANTPVADPAKQVLADDDRPVEVNDVEVNEGSPYAVFTVGGKEGQYVKLDLAAVTATSDDDYANALEYWDGDSWESYKSGTFVKIPGNGDGTANEPANLLVRVAIKADTPSDSGETFTLTATNTGGTGDVGVGTIVDDGTGVVFASGQDDPAVAGVQNPSGVGPDGLPVKQKLASAPVADPAKEVLADDDRDVKVNDVEVNEASPYLVWKVTAKQGQYVKLGLSETGTGEGHATLGADTSIDTSTDEPLEYWSGSKWEKYVPGTFVKVPGNTANADGQLLVRLSVKNDFLFEDRETLTLTATNTGGTSDDGEGAIRDDGTGLLFGKDNNTGEPDAKEALGLQVLDDDRVVPPAPQPAAPPPPPPPAAPPATAPSLHVQAAVAEGRQATSSVGSQGMLAQVSGRASGLVGEGINIQRRLDNLIDKFDRVTDPNLYVLPEVKYTRSQSFEAKVPTIELQSGILFVPSTATGALPDIFNVSQEQAQSLSASADAELERVSEVPEQAQAWWQAELEEEAQLQALRVQQLAQAHAAMAQAEAPAAKAKPGALGFSAKLKASAQQAAAAARWQA